MKCIDFINRVHTSTKRDYLQRVVEHDKAECAEIATQFGKDYWDGARHHGFGGYSYDGRWASVAERMVEHYQLTNDSKILDVGCGKGFLLYEFKKILPECTIAGLDISKYALEHSKEEVRDQLQYGNAVSLPFEDNSFDFIVSLNTLHNLYNYELFDAVKEIERVGSKDKYIVIEAYRNEQEKANLLYWQLTCRCFYTPKEWEWIFKQCGYTGDYGYIVFE